MIVNDDTPTATALCADPGDVVGFLICRSLKHCLGKLNFEYSFEFKFRESKCLEDERSQYLSDDQFTLTLHIHTSVLLLFLCAFTFMIQLRSLILKLPG